MTSIHRSRREAKSYGKYMQSLHQQGDPCQFCDIGPDDEKFIRDTPYFKIIRNLVPYTFWDDHSVSEHLLIVPRQHTDTISDFSADARVEYVSLLAEYENQGYSIYARPPKSQSKSVVHQHTHLIKIAGKRQKLVVYVRKPHVRVMK